MKRVRIARREKSELEKRRRLRKRSFQIRHFPGIFLSVLLISLLAYLLGWSQLLSLKAIQIDGTTQVSAIQSSIDSLNPVVKIGEPLARIDVHAIERKISENSWIQSTHIGRSWIHGKLNISVIEKHPVASYLRADSTTGYFDSEGKDFTSPLSYTGIPTIDLQSPTVAAKQAIALFLTQLPPAYLQKAQSFTVTKATAIEMTLAISKKRIVTISWGEATDIPLKIQVYEKLLAMKENRQSLHFDLTDPLAPITK